MRRRVAGLAVGLGLVTALSACGSSTDKAASDATQHVPQVEGHPTTTALAPLSDSQLATPEELAAFRACIDRAIEAVSEEAEAETRRLEEEVARLQESYLAFEGLIAAAAARDQAASDQARAQAERAGVAAQEEIAGLAAESRAEIDSRYEKLYDYHTHEGDWVQVPGGVESKEYHEAKEEAARTVYREMHESELAFLAQTTELAARQAAEQTASALATIDALALDAARKRLQARIEEEARVTDSVREVEGRLEAIERSRDLAIVEFENARLAADFAQPDWTVCPARPR